MTSIVIFPILFLLFPLSLTKKRYPQTLLLYPSSNFCITHSRYVS
jgi:hypothetical protein